MKSYKKELSFCRLKWICVKKVFNVLVVLLFLSLSAHAQQSVQGTVKDDQGISIPGVSVVVEGSKTVAVTDTQGKYIITVPSNETVLIFRYIGFQDQRKKVDGQKTINISLIADINNLNEVVVVGYGTQKKSDVTGAITSLNTKDLEIMPQTNIQQALQGKVAGLSASTQGASAESGNLSLRIRGEKSISANNDPLIILDGVIFSGSFSEISPEDIESLQVLKDASSAAIYGSRAANGVILISTKKGKSGKARIAYNNYFGIDKAINIPGMMSGERFYQVKKERTGESSITNTEQNAFDNGISTDWVGLALRNGFRQQHNLSVSGGSDNSHYFLSGTVNTNKGTALNDNFNKYNLRVNLDTKIGKNITVGSNTQLGVYDRGGEPADFEKAFLMNPLTLPFNADGSINLTPWPDDEYYVNPLEALNIKNDDLTRSVFTNNYIKIDFPFIKGLSYKLNTGYTYSNQAIETYYGLNTRTGLKNKGQAEIGNNNTTDWLIENILTYDRTFGKHTIGFTGLYSGQERKFIDHKTTGIGFSSDIQTVYQNSLATTLTATDKYTQQNNIGQMGRLNYAYDSKYLATVTVRRDGFSGFGSDTKYGVFPSIALGWNISNEAFMKDQSWIEALKLRVSYGKNGNQAIDPYKTLAQLSAQNYLTTDKMAAVGYYTNKLGDPSLGWESTVAKNIGLDFSLFKGRISGNVDYYNSHTSDLLLERTISLVNGVGKIMQNVGETKNHGVDLQISSINLEKKDFSWNTDFNLSINRNKIINVGLTDANGMPIDDIGNKWFIGKPIDVNFSYLFDGIWQPGDDFTNSAQPTAKPGDVRVKDINGDHAITEADKTFIGSAVPKYIAGLTNTFTYKNFAFSFFIRAVQGETRSNVLLKTFFSGKEGILDRQFWTAENPINTYPANRDDANPFNVSHFDKKTSNASFIRLQDVSLSYTLPSKLTSKYSIDRLQFFVNAKNMATHTSWVGLDPEFSKQTAQPQVRSFVFGIRSQF